MGENILKIVIKEEPTVLQTDQGFPDETICGQINLEIKKEEHDENFTECDRNYSPNIPTTNLLIKDEDTSPYIVKHEDITTVDYEITSTQNVETESIVVKEDLDSDPGEEVVFVRPTLFTLHSQLDHNLKLRNVNNPPEPTQQTKNKTLNPPNINNTTKSKKSIRQNKQVNNVRKQAVTRDNTTSGKYYHCKDCKKVFPTKMGIHLHAGIHNNSDPYLCLQCGKEYLLKCNIARHMKLVHGNTNKEQYKCDICLMTLKTSRNFTQHMREHTKLLLFECRICGEQYIRQRNLRAHVMSKHPT